MPETAAAANSLQRWATEHRGVLIVGTLAIAAFVTALIAGAKPLARLYQTSSEPARRDELRHYEEQVRGLHQLRSIA
jgi:hypothetical protein